MLLNKKNLPQIKTKSITIADQIVFTYPEKVLQFGTGVLLRGLPDYFIDKANRKGIFNGRIVVVKSTQQGDLDAFARQDFLYTHCIRGIHQGTLIEKNIINTSISRILNANEEWNEILKCAINPAIQIILSNTTEVGITFVKEKIHQTIPQSFPAKLLQCLYYRFEHLGHQKNSGFTIIPTELINDNAITLKNIIIQLAHFNQLPANFFEWLENENDFCNSLVDRIVPGKLSEKLESIFKNNLGYEDKQAIMSEYYALWAIQSTSPITKSRLSFCLTDERIIITSDISKYKEIKLRLLNGSHTFCCAIALFKGFTYVREAMQNKAFVDFLKHLMFKEIAPTIPHLQHITLDECLTFATSVIERFENPHIDHKWSDIASQYSLKMLNRNIPTLKKYLTLFETLPHHIIISFAAYICLLKTQKKDAVFIRQINHQVYEIKDDKAEILYRIWQQENEFNLVKSILSSTELWQEDLSVNKNLVTALEKELKNLSE